MCLCVFEEFFFTVEKKRKKKRGFCKKKIIIYVNDENQNSSSDNNNADEKERRKKIRERKDCVWESSTKLSLQLFMFCCCYRCSLVFFYSMYTYICGRIIQEENKNNFFILSYHVHRNFVQMENGMKRTSLQVKWIWKRKLFKVECILVWYN